MPSNQTPLGALPARFRRARILIIGCGDVGMRVVRALPQRVRVLALTSLPQRKAALRALGVTPIVGDLDHPLTVRRLAGLADHVIHLAPPPVDHVAFRDTDPRTVGLVRALRLRQAPRVMVYGSTTGVYGDCGGARVDETRKLAPGTDRARRRVHAERQLRAFGRVSGARTTILRIPGIYAPDRPGGTPRERLLRGTPALREVDDVYTNHIHADDLARACAAALFRARPLRTFNACDDSELLVGDYYDLAADLAGVQRPPRMPRAELQRVLTPQQMSFLAESRRLVNRRLREELRLVLRYPTVEDGLRRGCPPWRVSTPRR